MGNLLFEHNRIAYEAVLDMFETENRAAVVHPTGTGKSFIGFQLCMDQSQKKVCWLSPSEYIFQTQIENFLQAGGSPLSNVDFFTYAKLMLMGDAALTKIQPDYIVLDEFHRCGAEMWGEGVCRLLTTYKQAKILGLSATAIRYLDNQRNMADELFDGNVASEMTLGEAIVRGILNPPKYVLSVFSYQKDLKRYERRVKVAKNKAVRDSAEKYLEALRRALEKADGLDVVFDKHMTDRTGKYIVFCADFEHMHEMIDRAPEWFCKVDQEPHIYTAYSNDPATSKAFADFKKDDSDHLKLLFCIDMLNEGVHVDDVSGVILFRPTVSPIIYKQQIGRALSASKSTEPVIFDIVNNIENLYSIGTIEQEMQVAMGYYRMLGLDRQIVTERFQIIDEVRECKALFEQLNETLTASWEFMYAQAKAYYERKGDLRVPKKYKTNEGYSLGNWILTQRRVRRGDQYGDLSEEKIAKLDAIGMIWDTSADISWMKNYEAAKKYYEEHGNLYLQAREEYEGIKLGAWLARLRILRKAKSRSELVSPERIKALDEIGMIWDVPDFFWERYYIALKEFYQKYGHSDVPSRYVTSDGLKLGVWVNNIRMTREDRNKTGRAELTPEQIQSLDELKFPWKKHFDSLWDRNYEAACEYKRVHGDLCIPVTYVTDDGLRLGKWIRRQRDKYETLSAKRRQRIDELGLRIVVEDAWDKKFELVYAYYLENGHIRIPANYVVDGVWISRWLSEQIARYNEKSVGATGKIKTLTPEQRAKLESIGVRANQSYSDTAWDNQYEEAKAFYLENGHLKVPKGYLSASGKRLDVWLARQRKAYEKKSLTEERIEKLTLIGMVWEFENPWEIGYFHAEKYFERYGDLRVPSGFVCEDGYRLGAWISNQRSAYNGTGRKELSKERIVRLEKIGMIWSLIKRN